MPIYKITQTETHFGEANSLDEVREQWNDGLFDCGLIDLDISEADFENQDTQLETCEEKKHTFTFISGETYDVKASSQQEAETRLNDYLAGEAFDDVTEGGTLTELISRPCLECPADAKGWHKGDDVGLTFEGLKQAQNEAIMLGVNLAMDWLEDINYHDGANVLEELIDYLNKTMKAPEWQSAFFAKPEHSLYSTACEN